MWPGAVGTTNVEFFVPNADFVTESEMGLDVPSLLSNNGAQGKSANKMCLMTLFC